MDSRSFVAKPRHSPSSMGLIPGLPDDLACECLIRVPYGGLPKVASISKGWKAQIELPYFRLRRRSAGHSQTIIVMSQVLVDQTQDTGSFSLFQRNSTPFYRLMVFEPASGSWSELPLPPAYSDGLPMFCELVAAGANLVVMGGLDPVSWESLSSVYVYSFLSGTWRRGADMPGVRRCFFGCASNGNNVVFVAGGHDEPKNALRSAMAYHVERDEWAPMPDMARERDECRAIFHRGKFHVIGGYCTDMQGKFEKSGEEFDVASWQWGPVQEDLLAANVCPKMCVEGDGFDHLYTCGDGDMWALGGSAWRLLAKLPDDMLSPVVMTKWQGNVGVIGSPKSGEPHKVYMLDLGGCKWKRVDAKVAFTGYMQTACCLEI